VTRLQERVAALRVLAYFLVSCEGTTAVDDRGTLDGCGSRLKLEQVRVWCDRAHPFAVYCRMSPQPDYCISAKVSDDGTGDALYCCDPAGLR